MEVVVAALGVPTGGFDGAVEALVDAVDGLVIGV